MMLFSLPVVLGIGGGPQAVPCTEKQLDLYEGCLGRMGDPGMDFDHSLERTCRRHLQSTSGGIGNLPCYRVPDRHSKRSLYDDEYAKYSHDDYYDRYSSRANQAKLGSGLLGSSFDYGDAQTYGSSLDDYATTYGSSFDDAQTYGSSFDDAQTYGSSFDEAQTLGSSWGDSSFGDAQTYGSSLDDDYAQTFGSSFDEYAQNYGSSFGDDFLESSQKAADFRLGESSRVVRNDPFEPRASRKKRDTKRAQKSNNRRESRSSFRLGNSFNNAQKADRKTRRSQRFGSSRNAQKAKARRSRLESTRLGEEFGDELGSGGPIVTPPEYLDEL